MRGGFGLVLVFLAIGGLAWQEWFLAPRGKAACPSRGLGDCYVTARCSLGILDGQIAAEIGDRTGAGIIAATDEEIPSDRQGGAGRSWTFPGKPFP